jgi:diguanylate cyclase (GGDEF)-like protein/PAS domain S-box-containing protein
MPEIASFPGGVHTWALQLDAVSEAVLATDALGLVTHWNAAAERCYGWTAAEAMGRPATELMAWDQSSADLPEISRAFAAGGSWAGEITMHPHHRAEFVASVALAGMYDDVTGALIGVISVSTDVTALRQAEKAWQASQRELNQTQHAAAEQTRMRDARVLALVTNSADVAIVVDVGTEEIGYVSPAVTRLFGWLPEQLQGLPARSLAHPEDVSRLEQALETTRSSPDSRPLVEFRLRCADASYRWVEQTMSNLAASPSIRGLVFNVRDITQRRAAETAMRNLDKRYRLITDTAQEGIWATDPDGRTLYANQKLADLLGWPLSDIFALRSDEIISSVSREDVIARQASRSRKDTVEYELEHVRLDGSKRTLAVVASPLEDEGEHLGSLAMIADVTDKRDAEAALRYLAYHDPATGLPNRAALLDHLERPDINASDQAVLVIDIHQLHLVNDSLGHAAGDALVIELAQRWDHVLGTRDMLARMGGDEFAISVDGADETDATILADWIMQSLEEPVQLGERSFAVSASIGIALTSSLHTERDGAVQLRHADAAMFSAKSQGPGGIVVFTADLAEQTRTRLELFTELKQALLRDELQLKYQPVVDLATGRLLGVEALCRWMHAERGVINPDEFIPIAEAGGLIDSLDRWVLHRACRDAHAMRAAGTLPDDAYVAVNVSASKLARPDFESAVRAALAESNLPARALVLEVTESAVMNDPETARGVLESLRGLGVEVSLDDFGTGYSSLAYLRLLPFGTLKIDRSFVQNMTKDAGHQAIVTAVIDLANALGAKTIAEGVETAADLTLLRHLGCRAGQGFYWSPAVSPPDLAALISALPGGRFLIGDGAPQAPSGRLPTPRRKTSKASPAELTHTPK